VRIAVAFMQDSRFGESVTIHAETVRFRAFHRGRTDVSGHDLLAEERPGVDHLPPAEQRAFCNSQAFTLNVTRADMVRAGCSAGGRLFEAAACGHAHHQPPL
jgi:hypothetical protein